MLKKTLGLMWLALSVSVNAATMSYQITVAPVGWDDSAGTPFGMPLSPTLSGMITVDNVFSDINALVDFELTTGSKTWNERDFVGPEASFTYSGTGELTHFELRRFGTAVGSGGQADYLSMSSDNTFVVSELGGGYNFCNGCVSFSPVPLPAATWLFGSALFGLVAVKRKKA